MLLIQKNKNDIILLLDKKISNKDKIPSLLSGYYYVEYQYENNDEYYLDIINIIKKRKKEHDKYSKTRGWEIWNYKLSDRMHCLLSNLMDAKLSSCEIKINKKQKKILILLHVDGGYSRAIDVVSKSMYLKQKKICLSTNTEIYNDLKHIELLANSLFFK